MSTTGTGGSVDARRRLHASWREWRPSDLEPRRVGPLMARIAGSGGVPVVLLHGLAASSAVWGGAWDELARSGTLLVPDLLGFGHSPKPSGTYSLDEHAETVAACMAAADLPEGAVMVGHSFGALVALVLARRRPELVNGLVMIAPPLHSDGSSARRRTLASLGRGWRIIATDTVVAERLCRSICTGRPGLAARMAPWCRPALPPSVARAGVMHSWQSFSLSLAEVLGARARPEWIEDLRIPVHILFGDRDRGLDHGLLWGLGRSRGSVKVGIVVGQDHLLPLTAPQVCLARVEELRSPAFVVP